MVEPHLMLPPGPDHGFLCRVEQHLITPKFQDVPEAGEHRLLSITRVLNLLGVGLSQAMGEEGAAWKTRRSSVGPNQGVWGFERRPIIILNTYLSTQGKQGEGRTLKWPFSRL